MSRYGTNIRKIAQTEELKKAIIEAREKLKLDSKGLIAGGRGIAYDNGSGVITSKTGAAGQTTPDNDGSPETTTPDEAISDKQTNADTLVDGTAKPKVGDTLGKIPLKDCSTGDLIDVRFDSGDHDGEASFVQPPASYSTDGSVQITGNWGADGTPPAYLGFELGFYWYTPAPVEYMSTPFDFGSIAAYLTASNRGPVISGTGPGALFGPNSFSQYYKFISYDTVSSTQYDIIMAATDSFGTVIGPNFNAGSVNRGSCPVGIPAEEATACPSEAPTLTQWDDSVTHQLSYNIEKGGFYSSEYDKDIPTKYKRPINETLQGFDELNLCTLTGDPVTVKTSSSGGFYFFADDGFGSPDGVAPIYRFDAQGKFTDTITEERYNALE